MLKPPAETFMQVGLVMTTLDIFAFIVMGVICLSIIFALLLLARVSPRRSHPQSEAIKMCGWLRISTVGIPWSVAFI
jgi:hypothetical protein